VEGEERERLVAGLDLECHQRNLGEHGPDKDKVVAR
jgi:hypothetical protein